MLKRVFWIIFVICPLLMAASTGIIPNPQEIEFYDSSIELNNQINFVHIGYPENLAKGKEILSEALADIVDEHCEHSMSVILEKNDEFSIHDIKNEQLVEAYSLEISTDKIVIRAVSDKGLFYGLMSLSQLVKASAKGKLPTMKILDYPDMIQRGISDDFSRGQVSTMDNFEDILRFLAEYKQNIYMPYMEDLVQLDNYLDIGEGRGALSKQNIAEMQDIARSYFIDVIPIFQTLGHYENILSHPKYRKFAEFPGAASLNTIDEATDSFLFNMLDEVIPQFESEYFHMGCDESRDVGYGATKRLVEKIGTAQVHADHYMKVYNKLQSKGKKPMMYGDIILRHPEILDLIPKDIIIVDWHYRVNDHYPSIKKFKDAGFQFLVSPGLHNWRQSIPNFSNAWLNISKINYEGYLNGALGSINSSWGDYGGLNFRELNYLGYAFGAESSWNPDGMDGGSIRSRFIKQYYGSDSIKLESLFLIANQIPMNTDLRYIYANPFLTWKANSKYGKFSSQELIQNGKMVLKLTDELRETAMRNKDKLDYFSMGARIGIFTGRKIAFKHKLDFYTDNNYINKITPRIQRSLMDECDALIEEINSLVEDYRALWLRTNRPDNLDRLMSIFYQQSVFIHKAKTSIEMGQYRIDQALPSKWIAAKAYRKGENVPSAYFCKKFELENINDIRFAHVQLIANDAAEIYLNGKKVGLVAAAKSGSLLAVKRQVGVWDIADLLQEGENIIAVKAQAYKPGLPSCANVYFEYSFKGEKVRILSDRDWQACTIPRKDWQLGKGLWRKAIIVNDYPSQISMPMFDEGFPSQIEL